MVSPLAEAMGRDDLVPRRPRPPAQWLRVPLGSKRLVLPRLDQIIRYRRHGQPDAVVVGRAELRSEWCVVRPWGRRSRLLITFDRVAAVCVVPAHSWEEWRLVRDLQRTGEPACEMPASPAGNRAEKRREQTEAT